MKKKNTSKKNSENKVLSSNSNKPRTKYCNDGLVYWIHNEEHNCISYGKIYDKEPNVIVPQK